MRNGIALLIVAGMGLWAAPAAAACPSPSTQWIQDITDKVVGNQKIRTPNVPSDVLGAQFDLSTQDVIGSISDGTIASGTRSGQASVEFGDVAWVDGTWFIFLFQQWHLAVNGETGESVLIRGRLDGLVGTAPPPDAYYRICNDLPATWAAASKTDPHMNIDLIKEVADDQGVSTLPWGPLGEVREIRPGVSTAIPAPEPASTPGRPGPPSRVGVSFVYDHALGPSAGEVFASSVGGSGWLTRELRDALGVQFGIRYSRADRVPTRWDNWSREGELSSWSVRFQPDVRMTLLDGSFEVAALAGPSLSVFDRTIRLGELSDQRREAMIGGHIGAETIIWFRDEVGVVLSADGALFAGRADPAAPIIQAGGQLGITRRSSQ